MSDLHETHLHAQEESITPLFFKDIPSILSQNEDEEISELESPYLKLFSTVMNGSFYVLDFHKRCFHFVSEHNLFLSGYSFDDALKMGYNFFSKIVYPDDLQLFIDIHRAILHYLSNPEGNPQEIDYFAFNVRLQNHGQPLMVYHKMAPKFVNGHARMAICHLSSSVIRKSGNLELYFSDKEKYSQYSFKKQQWLPKVLPSLTNREKDILKLSKQGKCSKEIADILGVKEKTIRNIEVELYQKLGVHTMLEAVIFATNHQLIFTKRTDRMETKNKDEEINSRKTKHSLTNDILLRIQQGLNNRQSVNSIAIKESISEGAIRYAIKNGRLH